jgi:hydrogenase/urease accessory protein HupE
MRCAIILTLVFLVRAPETAKGVTHDVDVTGVARVFLDQIGAQRYLLSIVDTQVPPIVDAEGVLPAHCTPLPAEDVELQVVSGFAFECDQQLTFDDAITLPWSLAGVVVLARWSDGTEASAFFRGRGGVVPIPLGDLRAGPGSLGRLASRYLVLGTEHILGGIDHLLFVLGLLLLVSGFWPLVKTVTAFTVAHSITLAAAVLGYVPVQTGPVEAAIALSIVLLAREVVMGHRGRPSLVHRQPWLVAFIFGLLHGLGFAGALGEIGLRSADIAPALLFFNLGVEAGQLVFVVLLVIIHQSIREAMRTRLRPLNPVVGYALGVMAMFWFLERLPAVWGA